MISMKTIYKLFPLLALAMLFGACQSDDEADVANKAFITEKSKVSETIIKGTMGDLTKTLTITMAKPVDHAVTATAQPDKNLLDTYNKTYYDSAILLPDSCYEMTESKMTIDAGSVKSTEASIKFQKLNGLNRDLVYVLPVTVNSSDIELIQSSKNYYYVFKGGALINVVADIEKNWLQIYPWSSTTIDRVEDIQQITMEALVYPREFGKLISTIMGIEGSFLMRVGDAGVPDNQVQIATSSGNYTNAKMQLQTNKWQHVAMTYDRTTGEMLFYINGKQVAKFTSHASIDIEGNGSDRNFLIGKSYDDARWFTGCISEVRVWDVIRTPEEIANNIYTVDPTSKGLLAYWKFDDQSTYVVKDYSGNGNDLKANGQLTWKSVSLPEKN